MHLKKYNIYQLCRHSTFNATKWCKTIMISKNMSYAQYIISKFICRCYAMMCYRKYVYVEFGGFRLVLGQFSTLKGHQGRNYFFLKEKSMCSFWASIIKLIVPVWLNIQMLKGDLVMHRESSGWLGASVPHNLCPHSNSSCLKDECAMTHNFCLVMLHDAINLFERIVHPPSAVQNTNKFTIIIFHPRR